MILNKQKEAAVHRIVTAREQAEMLSPWRTAAPIHDNDPLWALLNLPPGGTKPSDPSPQKPASPPSDPDRYYKHLVQQPDRTHTAHAWLPTDVVDHYQEYDRDTSNPDYQAVKRVIGEQGVRQPLWISANDTHGLLVEGNNRLKAAKELGISHLPVRFTHDAEVMSNEGNPPVPHHPVVKGLVDQLKQAGRFAYRLGETSSSGNTVYRGLNMTPHVLRKLFPRMKAHLSGQTDPTLGSDLLHHLTSGSYKSLGTHWTEHPGVAHYFANGHDEDDPDYEGVQNYVKDKGNIPLVLEGKWSGDPSHLAWQDNGDAYNSDREDYTGGGDQRYDYEHEKTLRPGSPVTVTGLHYARNWGKYKNLLSEPQDGLA